MLVDRGRLRLTLALDAWIRESMLRAELTPLDLDLAAVLESTRLPEPCHKDPADRFLIATARTQDLALVTADDRIRRYQHCRTVW